MGSDEIVLSYNLQGTFLLALYVWFPLCRFFTYVSIYLKILGSITCINTLIQPIATYKSCRCVPFWVGIVATQKDSWIWYFSCFQIFFWYFFSLHLQLDHLRQKLGMYSDILVRTGRQDNVAMYQSSFFIHIVEKIKNKVNLFSGL